jgi:SAM-dependent methyltransferase
MGGVSVTAEPVPVPIEVDWTGQTSSPAEAARLASFYDLAHDSSRADVEWCRQLARRSRGPILELGCGSARVAAPLAADGHRVVGVDRSRAMLDRARRRAEALGTELDLVQADLRTFDLSDRFALVLLLTNTFLLLLPEERARFLARVRRHLLPDGRLVIHVFQPDPAIIAASDGRLFEAGRYRDPESGTAVTLFTSRRATVERSIVTWRFDELDRDGTVRRWERSATLHFLYRREAELLLDRAGFMIESIQGDFDRSPASERSPRLLITTRPRPRSGRERRSFP